MLDHPHAGGEHILRSAKQTIGFGPSPRGWGALASFLDGGASKRTIPTRVGSTGGACRQRSLRTIPTRAGGARGGRGKSRGQSAHPTAGGNPWARRGKLRASSGPSPRGWGAPNRSAEVSDLPRTIPTRVGSTDAVGVQAARAADHPHAGGEHSLTSPFFVS